MKFAHMGDCHLGGWRQPELKELNLQSFQYAVSFCIKEKVEFILISGDLFDSAYPPIETLKETFNEFRKLKEAKIPVFLIAGSHDYSASGKTFLDVLEKAGFCTNTAVFEEHKMALMLLPTLHKNVALYGYPGRKSGLEVEDIKRIHLQDAPGMFKILMLHTAIRDAVGSLPIPAVEEKRLPKVDYLALSHLHVIYQKENRVYSGPIFPNTLAELEELKGGSFYIFDNGKVRRESIKLREISSFTFEITNALTATHQLIEFFENQKVKDNIVILHLKGLVEKGRIVDIDFPRIEEKVRKKGAYSFIKSTTKLVHNEAGIELEVTDPANLESSIIEKFIAVHPSKYNAQIPSLLRAFQIEQMDDEKAEIFEDRLCSEVRKVLQL
ncbi:metallophosphoesterase [Candidatus Pacearchaeota archaeon]|nr:metallophosphoesterase [Candidatus Pacearchaeota archaeon]